jgi:Protein of unknown function, DUF417
MSRAARSDRPLYARNQHLQPGQNRHGVDVTIIPFIPDGWAASAGGFPAITEHVAFLMKDIVLFSASVYLLRQDVMRVSSPAKQKRESNEVVLSR